jgi:hypothetical protein
MTGKILAATMGSCIHVAGVMSFLRKSRCLGFETIFLGAAIPIRCILEAIQKEHPDIVAISYRLSPESFKPLLSDLKRKLKLTGKIHQPIFLFGGTPPLAQLARQSGLFKEVFDGTEPYEKLRDTLLGKASRKTKKKPAGDLVSRIKQTYPIPLLRHHYGRPTIAETLRGVRQIADSGVLDILSLGPDQNAQQFFFHPSRMDRSQKGAGGVPLRKRGDLEAIFRATRRGNSPLVRCYAGTQDLMRWAIMSARTIRNAWGAIPLCWYSLLDGRSRRPLRDSIKENQDVIRWHASRKIPVEINEPHQWSLRGAHDALTVAIAYVAAVNAKTLGVVDYVCQYMFNTPKELTPSMDLAKMLAQKEMVESLAGRRFRIYTMTRAGLASLDPDPDTAKGQLAAATVLSLALKPHIVHVVGYSEGDHAVTADELIQSCKIVRGVLKHSMRDYPRLLDDPAVQMRKRVLIREAQAVIKALFSLGKGRKNALSDPETLVSAVSKGLFDAPDLAGNPSGCGNLITGIVKGACVAVTPGAGCVIPEGQRIKMLKI